MLSGYLQAQTPASSSNQNGPTITNPTPSQQKPDRDQQFQLQPGEDPENRLLTPFLKHIVGDQKQFWTMPTRLQTKDLKWIVPSGAMLTGFIASDSWFSKQVPDSKSQLNRSLKISDYTAYSLIGLGGASFLAGHLFNNDHLQEAGLLSGEAAINATGVTYLFKYATGRERPIQGNGNGDFFSGGVSFPSEHSAIAWSIASVWAHEYPGWLSQLAAYGLASTVSLTRVTAKEHFPSDVIVGSALGWYFGRQVYRAHHDPEVGGSGWGEIFESKHEGTRNPDYMASPYVPMDSWIYNAFDRLIALGYVNDAILSIRPWTRMECARLLEDAATKIAEDEDSDSQGAKVYQDLASEFSPEIGRISGAANVGVSLDSAYTRMMDIAGPPLRDGYYFGQTIVNDYGRPLGEGVNFIAGASGSAVMGPVAIYARGEYQEAPSVFPYTADQLAAMQASDLLPPDLQGFTRPTGSYSRFQLPEGYISFIVNTVQFSFGNQTAWLGPTRMGPFLYTDNSAPIPMFKIDTTTPYRIPLLSKILGPARTIFFLGRLSGQQFIFSPPTVYGPYPNNQPWIHGDKVAFQPTKNFQFGMGITAIFAGAGVPFTWSEFIRSYYSHTSNLATNPGKRFSAADFSYRVPGLRNWLTIYGDSMVVDEISPIGSTRASVSPGIYMPQIPRIPKLELRAEFIHLSNTSEFNPGFVYTDRRYTSGYTNAEVLMGSWIGRAGEGGQAWLDYRLSPRDYVEFSYRAQRVYKRFLEGGSINDFSVRFNKMFRQHYELNALFQYENWRYLLLYPDRKDNFTTSVQFTYWPHKILK